MAKKAFTDEQQKIWTDQILGTKELGLPSKKVRNLIDILHRDLGLEPRFARYGKKFEKFDFATFKKVDRTRGQLDGYATFFYDPDDCEKTTGSKRGNWLDWANLILGYGRKSHTLAPYMKPPEGVDIEGNPVRYRFLSLELIVFYLAIQTDTWENLGRIQTVKNLLKGQDIWAFSGTEEKVNVSEIINSMSDVDVITGDEENLNVRLTFVPEDRVRVRTRLPKAGKDLVGYNPVMSVVATAEGTVATRKNGEEVVSTITDFKARLEEAEKGESISIPKRRPVTDEEVDNLLDNLVDEEEEYNLLDSLVDDEEETVELSEDDIEAEIARLQAQLVEKKKARLQAEFRANAEQGVIVAGEIFEGKGQYMSINVAYPDGTTATYYHADVLKEMAIQGLGSTTLPRTLSKSQSFGLPFGGAK